MLSKTYLVVLNKPLGDFTHFPYIFYLHTNTQHEALNWVSRIFEGINVAPTLRRWSRTALVPNIGNSDPVVISDCDLFKTPERKSEEAVFERLQDVCANLKQEVEKFTQSFHSMCANYIKHPVEWEYERMVELKRGAELAEVWYKNLSQEMLKHPLHKTLTLPPILHNRAA